MRSRGVTQTVWWRCGQPQPQQQQQERRPNKDWINKRLMFTVLNVMRTKRKNRLELPRHSRRARKRFEYEMQIVNFDRYFERMNRGIDLDIM